MEQRPFDESPGGEAPEELVIYRHGSRNDDDIQRRAYLIAERRAGLREMLFGTLAVVARVGLSAALSVVFYGAVLVAGGLAWHGFSRWDDARAEVRSRKRYERY